MGRASLVQPPRLADRLMSLITPDDHTAAIRGDLLEEFSDHVSKLGIALARRWYWRQSIKTIAHLIGYELRSAPWLIAGSGLAALLLGWCCNWLTEKTAVTVLSRYEVYPHVSAHVFWRVYAGIERLLIPMFMGCVIAVTTKEKASVTAAALSLFISTSSVVGLMQLAMYIPTYFPSWYTSPFTVTNLLLPHLLTIFVSPIMIAIGVSVARRITPNRAIL